MALSGKPIVVCSNHQGSGDSNDTIAVAQGGVPSSTACRRSLRACAGSSTSATHAARPGAGN